VASADVAACVTAASDTNTINIPAGSATWGASAVTIPATKSLNIIGAGSDATHITLGGNYAITIAYKSGLSLASPGSRVSAIHFISPLNQLLYAMLVSGQYFRIDHNKFECIVDNSILIDGRAVFFNNINGTTLVNGLFDNNVLINGKLGLGGSGLFSPGQSVVWSDAATLGTEHAIYIEDNTFQNSRTITSDAVMIDHAHQGAPKSVIRYNTFDNGGTLIHGLQTSGTRAPRHWEFYGNTHKDAGIANAKAGTGVIFNNKDISDTNSTYNISIYHERAVNNIAGLGYCDGTSFIDGNEGTAGWLCRDQVGAGRDSSTWVLLSVTSCADNGSGKIRFTTSTAHNLTTDDQASIFSIAGCNTSLANQDVKYAILAVGENTIDIDLAYNTAMTGDGYVHDHAPTQAKEPAYFFSNLNSDDSIFTISNVEIYGTGTSTHVQNNRDIYVAVSSFNGTSGVGCGTLANRPGTCTTGVGYWATDQSCATLTDYVGVNPTTPISGTLYKCTATDTWTAAYTPYTYPHPLRGEADTTAPTNVQAGNSISANGLTLTLNHSESITKTGNGTIVVTCGGETAAQSYTSGSGSANLVYTFSTAVTQGQVCTVSYTQGGNDLEDAVGNDLATYSGHTIVNGSTVPSGGTTYELTVAVVGGGTVNSSQGGVQCTRDNTPCTKTVDDGTVITFTLVPFPGHNAGVITGTGCGSSTTVDAAKSCTVTFPAIPIL